ncbi:hypothetical protein F4780DRAFT_288975 [Xylariomycetidae sp. FL0641]|nr:hypothetical protein F4780DRAFT_288975 [Xylariomycetidae sp. FL0641]
MPPASICPTINPYPPTSSNIRFVCIYFHQRVSEPQPWQGVPKSALDTIPSLACRLLFFCTYHAHNNIPTTRHPLTRSYPSPASENTPGSPFQAPCYNRPFTRNTPRTRSPTPLYIHGSIPPTLGTYYRSPAPSIRLLVHTLSAASTYLPYTVPSAHLTRIFSRSHTAARPAQAPYPDRPSARKDKTMRLRRRRRNDRVVWVEPCMSAKPCQPGSGQIRSLR